MNKIYLFFDTNIIINLYFVYEDVPQIIDYLLKFLEKRNISINTTNIVINEIKRENQRGFFFDKLSRIISISQINNADIDELRRLYSLYNMGKGELSILLYLTKNSYKFKNSWVLFLTADKKDVLKKMNRIKEILDLSKNIQITHGLFLYYVLFYEKLLDKAIFYDILYSSNRDFRISLQDKKEFERTFQCIYDDIFKEQS